MLKNKKFRKRPIQKLSQSQAWPKESQVPQYQGSGMKSCCHRQRISKTRPYMQAFSQIFLSHWSSISPLGLDLCLRSCGSGPRIPPTWFLEPPFPRAWTLASITLPPPKLPPHRQLANVLLQFGQDCSDRMLPPV